jgi:hypothetical protein
MRDLIYGNWPLLISGVLLCVIIWRTWKAWIGFRPTENLIAKGADPQERQMSLSSMSAATGAAITGASITLGVIGAVVGLGKVPPDASMYMRAAVVLYGLSVFAGVWIAAMLPQYANTRNVALEPRLGVALAVQVYSMFLGMINLISGIWKILSR